jgi:branched-chain amino acid aminotransferase
VWRRPPDYSIPSRAKVNGAYVNSVLGKQDAIDSGYDDCLFLDALGHVCELSASNIFIVRDGVLITPKSSTDILEGINRKTILELAADMNISTLEREIDLTEVYIADEAFACGTSTGIAPIIEVDARKIGFGATPLTKGIKEKYTSILNGGDTSSKKYFTRFDTQFPQAKDDDTAKDNWG